MKLKAMIPDGISSEVKWLVIEDDETGTGGYFLYHYLRKEMAYDDWYEKLAFALASAAMQYGLREEEWIILDGKI